MANRPVDGSEVPEAHCPISDSSVLSSVRRSLRAAPMLLLAVNDKGSLSVLEGDSLRLWPDDCAPGIGSSIDDCFPGIPDLVVGFKDALAGARHSRRTVVGDRTFDLSFSPVSPQDDSDVRACCLVQDITDRIEADRVRLAVQLVSYEEQQRRTAADLRSLIEGLSVGIVVTRRDRVVFFNLAAAQSLRWRRSADYLGCAFSQFFPPGLRPLLLVEPDSPLELLQLGELQITTAEGTTLTADVQSVGIQFEGSPASLFSIRDVTQIHQIEQDLRQSQRLEAIGRLAAGIAHEINTPIQFIGDNASFLAQALADSTSYLDFCEKTLHQSGSREQLDQLASLREERDIVFALQEAPKATANILEGVTRVAKIVSAMKAYAHPPSNDKVPADLNHALETTVVVATNEWKRVAKVVTEFGDIPLVLCHLGELNQVFLNLIVNAAHAIGTKLNGSDTLGVITIRTYVEKDEVVVAISDNGTGIPSEIRDRVFEPFFTTKEVGRGTGQGLAIARRVVVDQHGGRIDLASEVGQGTTFFVRLPRRPPQGEASDETIG